MAFTQGLCQNLQVNLNDVAGSNAPQHVYKRQGYLDAIVSSENTAGVEMLPIPTNGKYRKVQVNYANRGVEAEVSLSCSNNCSSENERTPLETIVDVDNCLETSLLFSEDEMRKLCEADSLWVSQTIMAQMNAINVALDKQMLALQASNFGMFADGTSLKSVKLFEDTSNASRAIATAQIRHAYDMTGASGAPMLIGGGNLDLFAKVNQIACCNSTTGTDLARWTDYMYFHDRFAESVFGTNAFAVLAPGAVQLVTWNRYVGDYAKRNDVFEHGTITDPFTGLTYDLKVHYDDCADTWVVKLQLHWTMFFIPSNAFASGDANEGINYTFNFEDCSTILSCD